jgi:hypothetical protein
MALRPGTVLFCSRDVTGWCYSRAVNEGDRWLTYIGKNGRCANFGIEASGSTEICVLERSGNRRTFDNNSEAFLDCHTFETVSSVDAVTRDLLRERWMQLCGGLSNYLKCVRSRFSTSVPCEWGGESVEQGLAARYLTGNETILEFGGYRYSGI